MDAASMRLCLWLVAAAVCQVRADAPPAGATAAPVTGPATRPAATAPAVKVRDLCKDAVDPYNPGLERVRFFAAAGVDGEIDAREFEANRKRRDPFVRAFDKWNRIALFDQNRSKTIDWFEADAYRRDIRRRVLKIFDTNKDSRLTGAERGAANRALALGPVGPAPARLAATASAVGPKLLKRFDKDGDGKLSEPERRAALAAFRQQARNQSLARYDKDGDGELNEEERAAMRREMRRRRRPWQNMFDRFNLRHFDLDENGKLDEEEKADLEEFQAQFQKIGRDFSNRQMDLDGDGKVTSEERADAARQWRASGWRMAVKAMQYMDADGDGTISEKERGTFAGRLRDALGGWIDEYAAGSDKNSDGRLDKPERTELLKVFRSDFRQRQAKFDADHDGRLAPKEMINLIDEFAREIGLKPSPTTTTPPAK